VPAIEALMSVEYFDEQRRQLIEAIRARDDLLMSKVNPLPESDTNLWLAKN
jgi:hypothetical protein